MSSKGYRGRARISREGCGGGVGRGAGGNYEYERDAVEDARRVPSADILPASEAVSFRVESEPDPPGRGVI